MIHSFPYLITLLVAGVALIVLLTARYKVPAFFALLLASLVVGLGIGLPLPAVLTIIKDGFGNILKSLGLIIVLGTALGVLLEYTNSTAVLASAILKTLGYQRAPWAMSVTGFVAGLPIFCDSGFIVLSGLNRSIAKRTGIPMTVMASSLATGLYAVHCLIPPHPGSAAAAGIIGVDFGRLMLIGACVAMPGMIVSKLWSSYAGKNSPEKVTDDFTIHEHANPPSLLRSCLPIIVPILLIAAKSFLNTGAIPGYNWLSVLAAAGDPIVALAIGVVLAFFCKGSWTKNEASNVLQDAAEKAGSILVVIGMGGAFGAVLTAAKIGEHFSQSLALGSLGIFFPFLLTSVLKTAQGSSTVAIITAATIVLPLLPALGLTDENGRLFCVLAMGAGSMIISHANDAYFWVIARFSGLEMKAMLRVYSVATVLMGLTTFAAVYILSKIL